MAIAKLPRRITAAFTFLFFYCFSLLKTGFIIAWDILTVKDYSKPGFIHVPLEAKTDIEIALIANLITFSPGTMVMAISEDKKFMTVHVMFLESTEAAIQEIKHDLERRVLEVLR